MNSVKTISTPIEENTKITKDLGPKKWRKRANEESTISRTNQRPNLFGKRDQAEHCLRDKFFENSLLWSWRQTGFWQNEYYDISKELQITELQITNYKLSNMKKINRRWLLTDSNWDGERRSVILLRKHSNFGWRSNQLEI